jgi:putative transposase
MAHGERMRTRREWQSLLAEDRDLFKGIEQTAVQEVLEGEMSEAWQADNHERTGQRVGYRSGYYPRTLMTRVRTLELRVPQDREGRFFHRRVRALSARQKPWSARWRGSTARVSTRRVKGGA